MVRADDLHLGSPGRYGARLWCLLAYRSTEPLTYGLWARVVGMFLICVVILEGAVRLLLPTPPQSPPPQQARLVFTPEARERLPRALPRPTRTLPTMNKTKGRVVVHLGDSMVFGTGVSPEARFTRLLDQEPRRPSPQRAFPGRGPTTT